MQTTWEIIEGDCRASLAALPAGSVQTCVTSPPLTREQVAEIKASPLGPRALAKQYGVHRQTIGNIRSGKTWRDVEPAWLRENAASARLLPTESRAA